MKQLSTTNVSTVREPWLKRLMPIAVLVGVCWIIFFVNNLVWHGDLTRYGIVPRHLSSLAGIIWSPFLHANLGHLTANTVPLFVLGAIICGRSRAEFRFVTGAGILLGGVLTWLLARNACHVGASGLIFCYFGYLTSMACFNRNIPTVILSALCLFGYGGILKGILPTSAAVSWEGHLAGLLSGIFLAWLIAKVRGTPDAPSAYRT